MAQSSTHSEHGGTPLPASNIIVFGQTGAGKSSLVNMLAGRSVTGESSGAAGHTETSNSFKISRNDRVYTIWDTPGLNEGDKGTMPAREAMDNLCEVVKDIGSVHLLVYCVRGRFVKITRVNYDLFCNRIVGKAKLPILLVVTGLEQESKMDDWWDRNKKDIGKMGMTFAGHACVTTTKGGKDEYKAEYSESEKKVWKLVERHCKLDPWIPQPGQLEQAGQKVDEYMEEYNSHHLKGWRLPLQIVSFFAKLFGRRQ